MSEAIETINGILTMFNEPLIAVDASAPIAAQYQELHDKYLESYFAKMPEAKKTYRKTGLLNDLGYHYLMKIKKEIGA